MTENIWKADRLDRKKDADFLIHFLAKRTKERAEAGNKGSFVLNLDAPWGHGKTFFLTRMQKQLTEQEHLVAYINAWEDDHASDPLLAVISEIDTVIQPYLPKNKKLKKYWNIAKNNGLEIVFSGAKHIAITAGKKLFADGVEEISDMIEGGETDQSQVQQKSKTDANNISKTADATLKPIDKKLEALLKGFRQQKDSEKLFRENLRKFLELVEKEKKNKLPFFILIDELDRCRPTHAVQLLERIKHLFDIPNIVFVLATDTSQLRHAVRGVYGGEFDSTKYLLRFFDRTYMFLNPDKLTFVKYLFEVNNIDVNRLCSPMDTKSINFFTDMMLYFELGLRDIEQCFDMFHDFYTGWSKNKIQLGYLLPLICTFHQGKLNYFELLSNPEKVKRDQAYQEKLNTLGNNEIEMNYISHERGHQFRGRQINGSLSLEKVIDQYILFLGQSSDYLNQTINNSGGFSHWFAYSLINLTNALSDHERKNDSVFSHNELRLYSKYVKNAGRLTYQAEEEQEVN